MTIYNGIECPCYGTLEEIHKILVTDLNRIGDTVLINGWGLTVTEKGFRSKVLSKREFLPSTLAKFPHPGIAILTGLKPDESQPEDVAYFYEIVTMGRIPHVSKRCAECGCQMDRDEIKRGACSSCYSAVVS